MIDLRRVAAVSDKLSAPFGIEASQVATLLRELADSIDTGAMIPCGASVLSDALQDDFQTDTLVIEFCPRREGWKRPG